MVNKLNKIEEIRIILLSIAIALLIITISIIIIQHSKRPYGYFDGKYICRLYDNTYWDNSSINYVLAHEECHALVDNNYKHFCKNKGVKI